MVVNHMVDDARNNMKADHRYGFNTSNGKNVMPTRKDDESSFNLLKTTPNFMDMNDTNDDDGVQDTKRMNYQLLLIMHADSEMRPCRPVIRVVSLPTPPNSILSTSPSNSDGSEMQLYCQLGGSDHNTTCKVDVETQKILCIYGLGITDSEAGTMIRKVSRFNKLLSQKKTVLSERSNMALIPVIFHNSIPVGPRCIDDMVNVTSATDVQIAIITILESINKSRSLTIRIGRLHPYLATPENLHEAISIFMRRLSVSHFKKDVMKFSEV